MKNRRKFIKTIAAGTSALALNESVQAQVTESLPAITSLLLDDDSAMVTCSDVACASFKIDMNYVATFPFIDLQLETPGGTRLVADGANDNGMAGCNDWSWGGNNNGSIQFLNITLSDATVNPGRYQIFAKNNNTALVSMLVSATACGVEDVALGLSFDVNFVANVSEQIGSINISSGGSAIVRVNTTTASLPI